MSVYANDYYGEGGERYFHPAPDFIDGMPNISRGSSDYAQRMRAWLTQAQYQDYQTRFLPHEQTLLDDVSGKALLDQRLSAIQANTDTAFTTSQASGQRRLSRYGVSQTGRERLASRTHQNLNRNATIASAQNATRHHIDERNMNIIGGGTTRQAIYNV